MKKRILFGVAGLAALLSACSPGGDAKKGDAPKAAGGSILLIDGSSTVYPISEALGEEFQKASGTRVTVGLSGTGGGFKKFCRGEIDIAGASRPIKAEEVKACADAGVEFIELPVALDALAVVVNPGNKFVDCLTVDELKKLWEPAAQGKVTSWKQVRASFPDQPVKLFGAGTDSGTFDYFTKAVNGEEGASRGDYTATEDDNVTINGVSGDANALGYLGLAYVTENASKVKAVPIRQKDGKCVAPSVQAARDASYQPLSRPLFYYVNKKFADERPHVPAFLKFAFTAGESEKLVGEVGYVPLPTQAYALALAKVDARKTGSFFDGGSKVGVTVEELLADVGQKPVAAAKP
ncbi:MAG: phosphate-binding protein [Phenylobacterium sp. RIFCSPHIGHO2_01_FULL_69_31]|jgi:phosphate transport system substrate-binding protein|uniref:PstS family phosphate ABC transporter substrate-binding protein n=1 Tax=Phenylobacterium sp. RIFCSPHIGHO2_01_FULL_69_31 TaxID=1801944 RepID=UPI0008C82AE1|nr:PstS family phosphate ABC transporter substrate-binding protein [Phenylobacterium sp. RIFCSPHIGHO2_01_FULL_69_31]OHB26715.1 MAG: phosphate-binding protein [Phenylobacterium sp. RIFCSPHIGHO2_01_FULL_69_31]